MALRTERVNGDLTRKIRERTLKKTQRQIAEMGDISTITIQRAENSENIAWLSVVKLASALGVEPEELIHGRGGDRGPFRGVPERAARDWLRELDEDMKRKVALLVLGNYAEEVRGLSGWTGDEKYPEDYGVFERQRTRQALEETGVSEKDVREAFLLSEPFYVRRILLDMAKQDETEAEEIFKNLQTEVIGKTA